MSPGCLDRARIVWIAPDVLGKITAPWHSYAIDETLNSDDTENILFSPMLNGEHFCDDVQSCWESIRNDQVLEIHFGGDRQEVGEFLTFSFIDCWNMKHKCHI